MSIPYSGTITRSHGLLSAIHKQLRSINLKPVKKIAVQFDPFQENAVTARDFLFLMSYKKVAKTNLNCSVKSQVVCDRSQPFIQVFLKDAGSIKFLAENLTVLEILQLFNKHVSSLVKTEVEPEKPVVKLLKRSRK